jgi:hypothetical protein
MLPLFLLFQNLNDNELVENVEKLRVSVSDESLMSDLKFVGFFSD